MTDQQFVNELIQNAQELLDEAKILFENSRYKRSLFLALTCLEEILKLKSSVEKGSLESLSRFHNEKFKPLSDGIIDLLRPLQASFKPLYDQTSALFPNKSLHKEIMDQIKGTLDTLQSKMSNIPRLRQGLLYVDHSDNPLECTPFEKPEHLKDFNQGMMDILGKMLLDVRNDFQSGFPSR